MGRKKKQARTDQTISPGRVIRKRRLQGGWKAKDFAKAAQITPQTLNAIEMGRIEIPGIESLTTIAHALDTSVSSLFVDEAKRDEWTFFVGDKKGKQTLDYPKEGFRVVCYTPLVRNLFVGKIMLRGNTQIEPKSLPTMTGLVFAQVIIGKLNITFDGDERLIKEGSYTFFDASLPHYFSNPGQKEVSFLLVTTPSFLVR